jgi:hypothetical protein
MRLPPTLLLAFLPSLVLGACLAGCSHTELPMPEDHATDLPFLPGDPLRLTYSPGSDRTAQWAPDGVHIYYAFDEIKVNTFSWAGCVAPLPATGGRRGDPVCETDARYATRSSFPSWPTRSRGGEIAFWRWVAPAGPLLPGKSDLVIRPVGEASSLESIILIPYFEPVQGRSHQGIAFLQWLGNDSLIFVGLGVIKSTNDNVETGLEIVTLDPALGMAGIAPIPGTTWASSVALGGNSDTLYFTVGGDSMVYRRVRSTGVTDTTFDFGPLGIARDVQVRAGRLTAVVGGSVTWGPHATLGMAQYDDGGPIYAVDLSVGVPVLLTTPIDLYRFPTLAPDGSVVIAERENDLWRITLP